MALAEYLAEESKDIAIYCMDESQRVANYLMELLLDVFGMGQTQTEGQSEGQDAGDTSC